MKATSRSAGVASGSGPLDAPDIRRMRPMLWACAAFLTGLAPSNLFFRLGIASCLTLACWRWSVPCIRREYGIRSRGRWVLVSAVLFFVAGVLRAGAVNAQRDAADVLLGLLESRGAEGPVTVEVVGVPRYGTSSFAVEGRVRTVQLGGELVTDLCPKVYVTVFLPRGSPTPVSLPGDVLIFSARFQRPEPSRNPGEFDRAGYLARRGVYLEATVNLSGVIAERGRKPSLEARLSLLRCNLFRALERSAGKNFPKEDVQLILALLLGADYLEPDETDLAEQLGLLRLMGATGFQVGIAMSLVERALRKLTRRPSLARAGALAAGTFLAFLSEFRASGLRVLVCNFWKYASWELGGDYDHLSALGFSLFVTAGFRPEIWTDPGVVLSYTASLASCFGRWVVPFSLIPPILTYFGELSVAGLLLGSLYVLVAGFLFPMVWLCVGVPGLGSVLGWIPFLILRGCAYCAEKLGRLDWLRVAAPAPGALEIAGYYLALGSMWYEKSVLRVRSGISYGRYAGFSRAGRNGRTGLCLLLSAALLFAGAVGRVYVPGLQAVFLYAGEGDSALLRWGSRVMMVDTGTGPAFRRHILPYLERTGIRRIDLLVTSHLHEDHCGGLEDLLAWAEVDTIAVPQGTAGELRARLESHAAVSSRDTVPRMTELVGGSCLSISGLTVRVLHSGGQFALHPTSGARATIANAPGDEENARSIAMTVTLGQRPACVLEFWSDLPGSIIERVLEPRSPNVRQAGRAPVIVAKVPHHGSADGLCAGFYERMSGGYAVISVGPNPHGHPSPGVVTAAKRSGVNLFRTDLDGAVFVRVIGGKLRIDAYRR